MSVVESLQNTLITFIPKLPAFDPGRRDVLFHQTPRLIAASTMLDPGVRALAASLAPTERQAPTELEQVISQLRNAERDIGNRALTFEEAQALSLPIAKLLVLANGLDIDPQHLVNRTFIVESNWRDEEAVDSDTVSSFERYPIVQFQERYPGFPMTQQNADYIMTRVRRTQFGYQRPIHGSFISLGVVNDAQPPRLRFQGEFDVNLRCEEYTPFHTYISVLMHEMFHDVSSDTRLKEPEPNIAESALRVFRINLSTEIDGDDTTISIGQDALKVLIRRQEFKEGNEEVTVYDYAGFNEFVTDYLAAKTLMRANLPYMRGAYASPRDISNFNKVLVQAGISDGQLLNHYRETQLRTLLLRLGSAAENITFRDEEQIIRFMYGFTLFMYSNNRGIPTAPLPWRQLAQFYPGLEVQGYQYVPAAEGCQLIPQS